MRAYNHISYRVEEELPALVALAQLHRRREEPELPPFDESKFEPMPEVEINPPDEFGG